MKFKRNTAAALLTVLLIVSLAGCKDLTNGYSTDPVKITDPSVINISNYLSGIEMSLIAVYEGEIVQYAAIWSDYFTGEDRQFIGYTNYIITAGQMEDTWRHIYNNVLANHVLLEAKAILENNYSTLAISQVSVALAMGLAADLWGDVPFEEATRYPVIANPKFDEQSSVYEQVQKLLNNAIANFNKNLGNAKGDFFLAGNKDNWIKVANSAKARYYLHAKDYSNAIKYALSGISRAEENLMAPHGNTRYKDLNLYYAFLRYDRPATLLANSYAPTLLDAANTDADTKKNYRGNKKTDENARLWWYYAPGGLDRKTGYEPNYACADAGYKYNGFFGGNSPFPLISFEETKLILAEAYMKQTVPDPANALLHLNALRQYYNTGAPFKNSAFLKTTYKYSDYVLTDFSPGETANTTGENQNDALLREILEERYVSFIGQFGGWTDMRRTKNFLRLPLAPGKTDFPKRMLYPSGEVNTNTNTPANLGLFDDVPLFKGTY